MRSSSALCRRRGGVNPAHVVLVTAGRFGSPGATTGARRWPSSAAPGAPGWPASLPFLPAPPEAAWPEQLRAGEPVDCLRSGARGVVVSIDDQRGEAFVAFRGSTVVRSLCHLARPGDA